MTVQNDWVGRLRRYPLKELRRRQNLITQQIETAYKTENTAALNNLHDMEDSLTEAVYLNEFT